MVVTPRKKLRGISNGPSGVNIYKPSRPMSRDQISLVDLYGRAVLWERSLMIVGIKRWSQV
jgi:hypothetical protein